MPQQITVHQHQRQRTIQEGKSTQLLESSTDDHRSSTRAPKEGQSAALRSCTRPAVPTGIAAAWSQLQHERQAPGKSPCNTGTPSVAAHDLGSFRAASRPHLMRMSISACRAATLKPHLQLCISCPQGIRGHCTPESKQDAKGTSPGSQMARLGTMKC